MANTKKATAEKETKTSKAAEKTEVKSETKAVKTTKKVAPAKAKEPVIKVTLEFQGKNVAMRSVVDAAQEAYKAEGNTDAIETLEVYVQPENDVAYYVVNGKGEGKFVNIW